MMKALVTPGSETPFCYDLEAVEDEFERRDFARRIAQTILNQPLGGALVVSIVGPWGSGKSTVLRFVSDEFAQNPCRIVRFNPWRFAGEDALLFHLFEALVKAIDPNQSVLSEWQQMLRAVSKMKKPFTKAVGAIADSKLPGSGVLVESTFSAVLPDEFKVRLDNIRDQTKEHLEKNQLRVVVLLDDVDRLDPDEILLLFRSIKLIADLPNTTFVIAMDEDHVSQIIGARISGNAETGRRYIEKIVNVRLSLPAIPSHILAEHALKRLSEVLNRAGRKLSREEGRFIRHIFQRLHAPFITTPRTAKVLQNAFTFGLGLLSADEVNAGDVLLLEATRLLHPSLYQSIQDVVPNVREVYNLNSQEKQNQEKAQEEERWAQLLMSFQKSNQRQKDDVQEGLRAWFPQLQAYGRQDSDEWRHSKRICSKSYFWRYFSGAIQKDDVHDMTVRNWITQIKSGDNKSVAELKEHLTKPYSSAFLKKIQILCVESEEIFSSVLLALAEVASRLPESKMDSLCGSIQTDAADAVLYLMKRINHPEDWENLAVKLIQASGSLEWSLNLYQHLLHAPKANSKKEVFKPTVSKFYVEMASQCLSAYESGTNPINNNLTITLMAGSIIRAAQMAGCRKRVTALVKKAPEIALHLLTYGCALSMGRYDEAVCWKWQGTEYLETIEKVVSRSALKRAVTHALPANALKQSGAGESDNYQTLEEVGVIYLECTRELSKKKVLEK